MDLYPFENLPVIITQLQSYFKEEAIEMKGIIRNILKNMNLKKLIKLKLKALFHKTKMLQLRPMVFQNY